MGDRAGVADIPFYIPTIYYYLFVYEECSFLHMEEVFCFELVIICFL